MEVEISHCGYEDYQSNKTFDLIYCVNVFEHVVDWQHMLHWASSSLKPGGILAVLCPNYSFPYESHFKIPILINKPITGNIFARAIKRFEEQNQAAGLWHSLNFVKKRHVFSYVESRQNQLDLEVVDDTSIVDDMVSRLHDDPEFKKRQRFIGAVASRLKSLGLFRLLHWFPNFLPYKLEFHKSKVKTSLITPTSEVGENPPGLRC